MLGHSEHGFGDLTALHHDHGSHMPPHYHRHHQGHLLWAIFTGMMSFVSFALLFHAVRYCLGRCKRPTLASQLSELSSQSATFPNPLLAHGRAITALQAAEIIPKSDPDWMGNVPWSDWQIDQEDILLCKRPDGRLWELGSGASATVPHIFNHCAVILV